MIDWPTIVEQHGPDVWRTAYRLLNDRDDANDCYQDTFLKAVEFARRSEVVCWPAVLRRIATARALDQLRRRYRRAGHHDGRALVDEIATTCPPAHAQLQLREEMEQLRQALTELPAEQAEVFWLCEVELVSHSDIAAQLGTTPQHIAVWLHRGKQKLRKLLAERGVTNEVQP